MDYIIFGIGTGSTLLLFGWLLRDMGPALRDRRSRAAAEVLGAQQLVDQMRWARFCAACGVALAMSGALLLLVTVFALLVNPSDAGGAWAVIVTFAIVSVAMLVWAGLFVSRFGVAGIYRARLTAPDARVDEADDDLDEEDDFDDATPDVATAPDVEAPSPVPAADTGPPPQETPPPAPALDPEEESIPVPEPAPDERQRVGIGASDGAHAVAGDTGDARDDEVGDSSAEDRPVAEVAPAGPDGPIHQSQDAEDERGEVSPTEHVLAEPANGADPEEGGAALPVPPDADREEQPTPVEPGSSERPGETDATPVVEDVDDRDGSGEGAQHEPGVTSGRVKALRQLQQRRQG